MLCNSNNYKSVTEDIDTMDWNSVTCSDTIDDAIETFNRLILDTLHKHTVQVPVSRSKFTIKPQMRPGLVRYSKVRDHLHVKCRNNWQDELAQKTTINVSPSNSMFFEPTDEAELNSDCAPDLNAVTKCLLKTVNIPF